MRFAANERSFSCQPRPKGETIPAPVMAMRWDEGGGKDKSGKLNGEIGVAVVELTNQVFILRHGAVDGLRLVARTANVW